jgi:hypothetical protein
MFSGGVRTVKQKELKAAGADLAEQMKEAALDAAGLEETHSHFWSNLGWMLVGAGLGSLTTYMLDPDRGRRRQALVRDQVVHARTVVSKEVPKKIRHAQNRIQGARHDFSAPFTQDSDAGAPGNAGVGAQSPEWESKNNDDGSLTAPTT